MDRRYERYRTHRHSRRLRGYDYATAGWYFVTICTRDRLPLFGEVRDGIVGLSQAGCIAWAEWQALGERFPRLRRDAFVVMPNHLHALLALAPDSAEDAPTLGRVLRAYKAIVTHAVRRAGHPFAWQPRFHDHIVRSPNARRHIRAYIQNNPTTWHTDHHHPIVTTLAVAPRFIAAARKWPPR